MASIPLLCDICPKQRKFSDLSHLLTHVGSKGHLSCYFKLSVRSRQDSAAREKLAAYDRWFEKYEVERLLSERLTLKEAKKVNGARGYMKHIDSANKQKTAPLAFSHRAGSYVVEEQLGSQHPLPYLKSEHPGFATTPLLTTNVASTPRTQVPRMHLWPTAREQSREEIKPLDTQSLLSIESENGTLSEKNSGHITPSANNPTSSFYPDPSTLSNFQDSSFLDSKHNVLTQDQEDDVLNCPRFTGVADPDMDGDGTKLKGVFWPGMDIFDSATPEMKRKRNQKKDGSVLEQMMINSAEVEPTELVFTPEGKLKKQQLITGMVESSSPMKEDSPKPKRRRSMNPRKPVLAEISGNYPRVTKPNQGRKAGQVGKGNQVTSVQQASRDALATLDTTSALWSQNNNRLYMPTGDEDSEWRLTLGNLGPKKRSGFTIFADTEQSAHTEAANAPGSQYSAAAYHQPSYYGYGSQNFGQLNNTSLLSSEFHLPSAHTPGKAVRSTSSQDHKAVPAISGPKEYRPRSIADKENSEPMMKRPGLSNHRSLSAIDGNNQHYFSTEGGPAPNFYHTIPRYTDLGGFVGAEIYSSSYHPMTYNFQQLHPQQSNGYNTSGFHTRTLTSPRRRMEKTSGSDPSYGTPHNAADNFGLDADEGILFGGMTD